MSLYLSRSLKCTLKLALVLFCLYSSAQAAPFNSVVVYGDSLSDNGNLFSATGIPGAPYFQGRRSNGPVAVEQLAAALGVPLIDVAWIGATTGIGNYGDGGTPTSMGALSLPGMLKQFSATQGSLGPYLGSGLFIVWGGPNDFLSPSPLDTTPAAVIARAVVDELVIVASLQALGAQHILVPGMPDLGLTPYLQNLGPSAAAAGSLVTDIFNTALRSYLPAGATFFDTATLMRTVVADPAAYGLFNVTAPCFDGVAVCADPSRYLFFDDFHPTAAGHQLLAEGFLLAAVPEPGTCAMLLAGIGLLALGARRRKQTA